MDMNDFHATTEDIYYAYRLLLGREPDAAGSEHYQRMLAEKSLTPDKLAEFFLGSSEFAARHNLQDEAAEVDFDGYSLYVRRDDHDIGMSVMQGVYEPQS